VVAPHVQFDEREWETVFHATAPVLDFTVFTFPIYLVFRPWLSLITTRFYIEYFIGSFLNLKFFGLQIFIHQGSSLEFPMGKIELALTQYIVLYSFNAVVVI
jgi:hypothetical protein